MLLTENQDLLGFPQWVTYSCCRSRATFTCTLHVCTW